MQFRIILVCLLLGSIACAAQDSSASASEDPIYFVDSVQSASGMYGLSPENIGMISIVKGKKLEALYGPRAVNGVIYVETKPFAHERYKKMFSELAPAYAAALKQYGSDSSFQYIVDGVVLKNALDPILTAMERKSVGSIDVTKVKDKQVSIVIKSR